MLRRALPLLKKRAPPLGFSRKDYSSKLRSPGSSKPWRDRAVLSSGRIDVTATTDVMYEGEDGGGGGGTLLGGLTTAPPLGLRSPHMPPQAAMQAPREGGGGGGSSAALGMGRHPPCFPWGNDSVAAAATTTSGGLLTPWGGATDGDDGSVAISASSGGGGGRGGISLHSDGGSAPYGRTAGLPRTAVATAAPSASSVTSGLPPAPMARLPFGKGLDLNVESVRGYEGGPVPIHLQHLRRGRREVADSVVLPRHINGLFHKIMGWSEELVDLDGEHALGDNSNINEDKNSAEPTPQLLRRKMANLTEKVKYGVLLDAYEKDRFALEHQLEVVGDKMERKFLEWEGVHILDQDAAQDLASVRETKAAIVMETPSSFRIPLANQDCCPGCGALLQDKSEAEFGFVASGEVERFVLDKQRKAQARHDYAQRMAELQGHWAAHGRQVGEEWLDFMTQEEFDAFYKDRQDPFVCHRCHALENLGVVGRRKIMSAPDFTEQLRALKERRCVAVLVVDITDFPGSMVYDLPGLISMNNEVIIVANKMDCVRNRSFIYKGKDRAVAACLVSERYVQRWVLDIATQFGLPRHRVRDVIPISAKRGWNVDKLIAAIEDAANLNLARPHKPLPTYFVGVANVGKSSVINAIAHKLYTPQPPHPKSTKVYCTRPGKDGTEAVFWRWYTPPNVNQAEMLDIRARHDKKASKLLTVSSLPGTTVSMNAVKISLHQPSSSSSSSRTNSGSGGGAAAEQTYMYDTPGLLPHWHRHSPLTLLQMRRTLIRKFRNPQCFILLPGHTLFLGGMAAVDIVKGPPRGILFMLYASHKTRHGIVSTDRSEAFWEEQVGKTLDPPGSLEQLSHGGGSSDADDSGGDGGGGHHQQQLRLSESKSYLFECFNKHRRRPKADIYVCGLGWASFCVSEAADVVLRVRTLPGVVHGVREPLRYNDLRAFRSWPKLKRRFTSKSIEDLEDEVDRDSINTVVRLTAGAAVDASGAESGGDTTTTTTATTTTGTGAKMVVKPVAKAFHPKHEAASSAPLDSLMEELQSAGKL